MRRLLLVVAGVLGMFIGSVRAQTPTVNAPPLLSPLPASFEGTLPCADCPGIVMHLELLPDHSFVLRSTYQDRPPVDDEVGIWSYAAAGEIVTLHMAHDRTALYAVTVDGLTRRDENGHPIDMPFDDTLRRLPVFQPLEPLDAGR
jgi:copper homeostasis protein (lipoprotein)